MRNFAPSFQQNKNYMAEYTVIIEHDPVTGPYCGKCQQLPEAISQGSTEEELMDNIREAIELGLTAEEIEGL